MTVARSPTASSTTFSEAIFSESRRVGDSPVVPLTTRPSLPASTRWVASRGDSVESTAPSAVKGVTIAVSMWPNGAGLVGSNAMSPRYRPGTGRA